MTTTNNPKSSKTTTTTSTMVPAEGTDDTTAAERKHQRSGINAAAAAILEMAANDDVDKLRTILDLHPSAADEPSPWYSRRHSSPHMSLDLRTPLMVAATFASLHSLRLLLLLSSVDVNRSCGRDLSTPLHCAAAGGSPSSPSAVRLLLSSGADPHLLDSSGRSPADVVAGTSDIRSSILKLLGATPTPPPPPPTTTATTTSSSSSSPRREYPSDPSLPDIKNSIYSTDEFRMYSFKVRPCSRAYSHDWTECPFVHPGENARRRDPRKYHYSCVPCPDFRKGSCRRGDLCEYAHGVFECWLHPAQYRTRLCKDGTSCNRRVCFFAHTQDELRPLYLNLGASSSGSPRSPSSSSNSMLMDMDMATALGMMPIHHPHHHLQQPKNPNSPNATPILQLSGSSRLRSALNARDIAMDQELAMLQELEHQQQLLGDISPLSGGRLGLNLDELFSPSNEVNLSPRYASIEQQQQQGVFSPSNKSAALMREFHQQQSVLSPINTNPSFLQSIGSPSSGGGRMPSMSPLSPRAAMDGRPASPMSARLAAVSQREKLRSLSSRELGGGGSGSLSSFLGSTTNPWLKLRQQSPSTSRLVDDGEEIGRLRRSNSFELAGGAANGGDEPDLSWVQSLVRESPTDNMEEVDGRGLVEEDTHHHVGGENNSVGGGNLGALAGWLDQMQL